MPQAVASGFIFSVGHFLLTHVRVTLSYFLISGQCMAIWDVNFHCIPFLSEMISSSVYQP